MIQIKLFEGAKLQQAINNFLRKENVTYVDIKYQVAASDRTYPSAILIYDDSTNDCVPDNKTEELSYADKCRIDMQRTLALCDDAVLDELNEKLAERLKLKEQS